MGGGELHLVVDGRGLRIESAAEDAREGEYVVDLVRIVGAPGRHHSDEVLDGFWLDFRARVGQGEDDRITGHRPHVLGLQHVRGCHADEHIGAADRGIDRAAEASRIGVLGQPLLHAAQAAAAR